MSKTDVSTLGGAKQLIKEARALGPVGGVFHLAMVTDDGNLCTHSKRLVLKLWFLVNFWLVVVYQVLKDGMFENMTPQLFLEVNRPKNEGIIHLDK